MSDEGWRRCSSCRDTIPFQTPYYTCNVSTCNRRNTAFVFCTVSCWDAHLPTMNHREAWAEEQCSPTAAEWKRDQAAPKSIPKATPKPIPKATPKSAPKATPKPAPTPREPQRRMPPPTPPAAPSDDVPREILIVASRLKEYIRARSGMNTSDRALAPLSDLVREICDRAIEAAHRDERKTVLDRDIPSR
ncbi:MAG: hypothetical protein GY723_17355 [bacterium]|nr:hypothetical protein [bacterium]MCP5070036.1 hypothetical protein [bacterium]